jgi:hypothetical protein
MYCSVDKIDLAARVDGRPVAIQTDHRSREQIEAEPELSALYAMARVLNARGHLAADGHPGADVHYAVADEPPPVLRDALAAVGAVIERTGHGLEPLGAASEEAVTEVAERAFAALARRAAARVGVRDLAVALRMLEDQTFAAPPAREDEEAYWERVLELAALTGELLRAKSPATGRWVQTERALLPFGFQLANSASGGSTVLFPTNRAQRVIEDGADESLFKLLVAADEAMHHPLDASGRLMPSLRDRRMVELDEVLWRSVLSETAGPPELPIVVCGVDGESTFGMIRRDAIHEASEDAMGEALRNLEAEDVQTEELTTGDDFSMLAVTGSFYAAEKVLDRAFMRSLHERLDADLLAAAVPMRGLLMVTAAHHEGTRLARFAALARMRHRGGGGRAISPTVLLVRDGKVAGFVRDTTVEPDCPDPGQLDDGPDPGPPGGASAGARDDVRDEAREGSREAKAPGFLRRLLGRKRAP